MMFKIQRTLIVLMVSLVAFSVFFPMPASADHSWTQETLDQADSVSFIPAIEMASSGPAILYGSSFGLNYTQKSGNTWTSEQIVSENIHGLDLELQSNGDPHAAFVYGGYWTEGIRYAHRTGGAWSVETVLNSTRTFEYISIELDASNNPYILCVVTDSGLNTRTLTLFQKSGGAWGQYPITTDIGYNEGYDFAISSSTIHVVYYAYSNTEIEHASRSVSGGSWQYRTIADGSYSGRAVSMDLDSGGRPHVMLGSQYYRFTGTLWNSESISYSQSGNLEWLDLHIDSQNNIYSTIFVGYDLVYAQNTGSGWEVETVRDQNDGWYCAVTADSSGQPHIAYNAPNTDSLLYLAGAPAATNPDSDGDGLPDSWEQDYFGNLGQGATDDPDSDGHDNLDEYNNGTDPTDATDPYVDPNDTDGDGLPDSWELDNFGNLAQDADDDPDNDFFDNEEEYIAGSDPNDSDSTPLDLGLDIFKSIIFWIALIVIVIVVVVFLMMYLLVKAADDVTKTEQPAPPMYPPPYYPPPQEVESPPSRFCPFCGHSLLEKDAKGGKCPKCGASV